MISCPVAAGGRRVHVANGETLLDMHFRKHAPVRDRFASRAEFDTCSLRVGQLDGQEEATLDNAS